MTWRTRSLATTPRLSRHTFLIIDGHALHASWRGREIAWTGQLGWGLGSARRYKKQSHCADCSLNAGPQRGEDLPPAHREEVHAQLLNPPPASSERRVIRVPHGEWVCTGTAKPDRGGALKASPPRRAVKFRTALSTFLECEEARTSAKQVILLARRRVGMELIAASVGTSRTAAENHSRLLNNFFALLAEQVSSAQRSWRPKQLADSRRVDATSTEAAVLK